MQTIDRKAWKFFHDAAGGIVGRRAQTAADLARAEAALEDALEAETARVVWEDDEFPDISWMDERQRKELDEGRTEMLCLRIEKKCPVCGSWETVACLGGIHIYSHDPHGHRRLFEAELASEANVEEPGMCSG